MSKDNTDITSILEIIKPDLTYNWKFKEGEHVILEINKIIEKSKIIKDINKKVKVKEDEFFIITKDNYFLNGMYKFVFFRDSLVYDFVVDEEYLKKAPLELILPYYERKEDFEMCSKLIKSYEN